MKPDAVTPSGKPVELKPNTPSGVAKGKSQLKAQERATGEKGVVDTKISRFDVNPSSKEVQKKGAHLNLEVQRDGKIRKNKHIPIDERTVRSGDYPINE